MQKLLLIKSLNAQPISLHVGNKTIKGYVWNGNETKTLLLLHGFSSAAYKFERYAGAAVKKGYRVIAFDAPAHGLSDGKTTHAVEYSQAIAAIIQQMGTVHAFIAHSFGGIALSLAMENLPHTHQTKIVFIAPATETSTAINKAFELLKIKNAAVQKEMNNIIFEMSGNPTEWFSIRRAVKNIQAQILWIHDEDDDITPLSDALKVKEDNHTNINFVITKGLGHQRIYHDAEVKKTILNFL
ncbi:MAG: alpha/beta hydrolase [Chitinophagaceae bacterium]|nr:alpha/beta hydrolase [Chitinophagaceae bacterium]